MKITLEFNTTDENFDHCELDQTLNAQDMALALWDVNDKIRNWVKWDERESIPKDEIREAFNDILQKYTIDLERLIQ